MQNATDQDVAIFGAGLGQSLDPAFQGLLSAGLEAEDTPRSFSYMGTLLGDLTGGPFMSAMMSIGGSSSTASSGFNFLASSVCVCHTRLHEGSLTVSIGYLHHFGAVDLRQQSAGR